MELEEKVKSLMGNPLTKTQCNSVLAMIKKEVSEIYDISAFGRISTSSEIYETNRSYILDTDEIHIEKKGIFIEIYKPKKLMKFIDIYNEFSLSISMLYNMNGRRDRELIHIKNRGQLMKLVKNNFTKQRVELSKRQLNRKKALRVKELKRYWNIFLSFRTNKYGKLKNNMSDEDKMNKKMFSWLPLPVKNIRLTREIYSQSENKTQFITALCKHDMFINFNQ